VTANRDIEFVLPGDLSTQTGGYIYDRRIIDHLRSSGWRVRVHSLDTSFPQPTPDALAAADDTFASFAADSLVVVDGLALGGMPDVVISQAHRLRIVALVHHPLALETGITTLQKRTFEAAERRALAAVRKIIVTSEWTGRLLNAGGVEARRIAAIPPGTEPAPLASGSGNEALNLLCVATLTPRKGHAILIDALASLSDRDWHLYCVGSAERDPATAQALHDAIKRHRLDDRITLEGELSDNELASRYAAADLFVLASHLEGYGMALAEALAHGLPVVSTMAGAIPDTVPADAGLLVPPEDAAALAEALAKLMDEREALVALTAGARRARQQLPTWPQAGARFAAALSAVA